MIMDQYNFILEENDKIIYYLNRFIPINLINIISEYSDGFIELGELADDVFRGVQYKDEYISCKIKYIHHSNLLFINFWKMDNKDYGDYYYPAGWWVKHHIFIINVKKDKLLYDKINFFIYGNGEKLNESNPNFPIYETSKLKKEYFETYDISPIFLQNLNILIKKIFKTYNTKNKLMQLLMDYIKYPHHIDNYIISNSIHYLQTKETYYEDITGPFIF